MSRKVFRRFVLPTTVLAVLAGIAAGLVVFLICATLWGLGESRAAGTAAQTALLLAICTVALVGFSRHATNRPLRVRVHINRKQQQLTPPPSDAAQILVAFAAAPFLAAATAALIVFR